MLSPSMRDDPTMGAGMSACVPKTAASIVRRARGRASREAKSRLPQPSRLGFRLSWGKPAPEARRSARIWGCSEALGLALSSPRCTGTRRLHSRRVRPARSLYRTHQRAQPSCKRIRAPGGQPAGRRAPTSWPDAARRRAAAAGAVRPAQCCGSPAGFASPTRRVELAAGGVETTVAGAECSAARRAELERKRAWFRNQQEEKARKRAAEAQRHKDRRRRVPITRPPRPRASLSPSRSPHPPHAHHHPHRVPLVARRR